MKFVTGLNLAVPEWMPDRGENVSEENVDETGGPATVTMRRSEMSHRAASCSLRCLATQSQRPTASIRTSQRSAKARSRRATMPRISPTVYSREGQALHPTSPYADLKRQAESKVLTMANQGLRFSIVRPFRTYGPGCTSGLVAEACQAAVSGERLALTDGQQVREWRSSVTSLRH